MRWLFLILTLAAPIMARAGDIMDATGRTVVVPEHIAHVLPAGPPAAVLLGALAPDLMIGWPSHPSPEARALLAPEAAGLPPVPRLTGHDDVTEAVRKLAPDLIVDYGDVTPDYVKLARDTQDRTGVPTILLDGSLPQTPRVLRLLGAVLHREARAETLAKLAEAWLAQPPPGTHLRVLYARGGDGLLVATPGTDATEVFARLGWQVVSPTHDGWFHKATLEQIASLDPDMLVFGDAGMRGVIAKSPQWQALRAVRDGHAFIAPAQPFGWVEEPPSLNRLLGLAWLGGQDPAHAAATFATEVYGHALTDAQVHAIADSVRPLGP